MYSINQNAICEVRTYANLKNNACNVRYIRSNHTFWLALDNVNSWLYSTAKEQEVTIQCKDNRDLRLVIKRTGKVSLENNCKMVAADLTIRTLTTTRGAELQTYLPHYNLTFNSKKLLSDTTIGLIEPIKLRKIIRNPRELMELSSRLGDLKEELDENEFLKPTFIYPVATGTIIIVILASIIMGIVIKAKCKKSSLPIFLQN